MFSKKYHQPRAYFLIGGVKYRWTGWFGCQLESLEWNRVPAGTRRTLDIGHHQPIEITVYTTKRVGLRVRTTWALSHSGTLDEQNARIESLRTALSSLI